MPIEIANCPLIGFLRNGKVITFNHDAIIECTKSFIYDLTSKSVAQIATDMFLHGYDLKNIQIDESRMKYQEVEL